MVYEYPFFINLWFSQENAELLALAHEEMAAKDKAYNTLFADWRKQADELRKFRKTTPGRDSKGRYSKKPSVVAGIRERAKARSESVLSSVDML